MTALAESYAAPLRPMLARLGTGDVSALSTGWDDNALALTSVHDTRTGALAALDAGWDGAGADAALGDAGTQQGGTATLIDAAHAVGPALAQAQDAVGTARSRLQGLIDQVISLVSAAEAALGAVGGEAAIQLKVAGQVAGLVQEGGAALEGALAALRSAAAAISGAPTVEPAAFPTSTIDVPGAADVPAGTDPAAVGGSGAAGSGAAGSGVGGSGVGGSGREGSGAGAGIGGSGTGSSGYGSGVGGSGAGASIGGSPGVGGSGGAGSGRKLAMAPPLQPGQGVEVNLPGGLGTVQAPNEKAATAVRAALTQLGVPYVWGGTSPGSGLDCSGLTQFAYGQAGVPLPRLAQEQGIGAAVDPGQVLPGDLAVWDGHVAMVIGNGQLVEAGDPVQVSPIRTDNIGMGFHGFFRPTAGEGA